MLIPQPVRSSGGGSPGGSDTQIQYNNAGAFAGSSSLTWDNVAYAFTVNASNALITAIAGSGIHLESLSKVIIGDGGTYGGSSTKISVGDNDAEIIVNNSIGTISIGDVLGLVHGSQFVVDDPNQKTTSNVKHETTGYITITDSAKGLVLISPNGHYWLVTMADGGVLTISDTGTSPP